MLGLQAILVVLSGVLIAVSDDFGWGDVSYNTERYFPGAGGGNWTVNAPHTPNLDAIASGDNTMLFRRFYSGSAVCSPTRSSLLSGRTPDRDCIDGAEGCGQQPAWSCYDPFPFPKPTFTAAQALKSKGYATSFIGKWHLGDFWVKGEAAKSHAQHLWPSSNPGMHGFDEWWATEASASSSTTNCGCVPDWKEQGEGCIVGGGKWVREALECTNYWFPTDLSPTHQPTRPECHQPNTTTRDCVGNWTQKITGDDNAFVISLAKDFIERKSKGAEKAPFLLFLWMHTVHEPHPALPQWYHAYNDTQGNPAGDYLGTISQWDAQLKALDDILKQNEADQNTVLWFTADNGAHTAGRPSGQLSASNGLRQCKASLFEGGIREPGLVRWPGLIKRNVETDFAAVTMDFLPTVMDFLDIPHPSPEWVMDGMSLMPLFRNPEKAQTMHRTQWIGWELGGQVALLNQTETHSWKLVRHPEQGQCAQFLPPFGTQRRPCDPVCLFDLKTDPTESSDACAQESETCDALMAEMERFLLSIQYSRVNESNCAATPAPVPPLPPGPSPNTSEFQIVQTSTFPTPATATATCVRPEATSLHAPAVLAACSSSNVNFWTNNTQGWLLNEAAAHQCLKLDAEVVPDCVDGNTLWIGKCDETDHMVELNQTTSHLAPPACPGLCAVSNSTNHLVLGSCDGAPTFTFQTVNDE